MIFSYDLEILSYRRETILVFVQIRTTYHTKGKKKFYMQKKQVGLSKDFPASIFILKEPLDLFQMFLFNTLIQVQKKYIKNGPTKSNDSTITLGLRP